MKQELNPQNRDRFIEIGIIIAALRKKNKA